VARKPHYGTVLAAGREGRPEARDLLVRLAGDPLDPAIVRATALALLAAYPGEASRAAYTRALLDEEALVRYTAALNLSGVDPETLAQLLAPLLFDEVRAVRMQAAVRLAALPDEALEPYQREARAAELAEYEKSMAYSLDFAFAGHNLGNFYAELGQTARAEEHYRAAIAIDELFFPAKVNLAMLLNGQGRKDEAETLLREVLEAYPEQHEIAYSLGLLSAELGRFEDAASFLERAAAGMPQRARVFYNLGLVQQQLGRDAEAALLRTLELEPDNLDYLVAMADFYLKRGDLGRAEVVADAIVARHPRSEVGPRIKAYIQSLRP
jgi:Tfp pilus assembly protein PilF